jgi:hypothetical protein
MGRESEEWGGKDFRLSAGHQLNPTREPGSNVIFYQHTVYSVPVYTIPKVMNNFLINNENAHPLWDGVFFIYGSAMEGYNAAREVLDSKL